MSWLESPCPIPNHPFFEQASQRQQQLTKPPGSLGVLEQLAIQFASWQARERPSLEQVGIRVFAADHGICAQGVSAFPAEVTVQMVQNFLAGGAAISVLSMALNADFAVVNMGTNTAIEDAPGLVNLALAPGTVDFSEQPAMSGELLTQCLEAGRAQVDTLDCQLFIAGDMGIGNTTSAAAILAALLELDGAQVAGRGTGVDDVTMSRKAQLIDRALALHSTQLSTPIGVLQCLGGLEIAGMCGAMLRSAQRGIPVLLDGFIATAAALAASRINPGIQSWLLAGHRSAEDAHGLALDALRLEPLLDLGMRLGEGSGAAVAVSVIHNALTLHNEMATFADAGVAGGE
jgi:nicotinate-nucleotide--dimethylbenzimidazole phosphoribosyltransferase